jgi:hypothetical protein
MTDMFNVKRFVILGALAATSASCGDVVRDGRSPVMLVLQSLTGIRGSASGGGSGASTLLSDVLTIVTSPAPCSATNPCPTVFNDNGSATLRLVLKDLGTPASPTAPTSNNEVTINRYRVVYRRADGRNTPGVDVPHGIDGAVTGTVPAGGNLTIGFELVRHTAKGEPPLVHLVSSANVISTIADVTFYGQDRVGNDISVTGSITVDFGNFGD